jgi:hypothetical protein
MSMHVEWDGAATCDVTVMSRQEANAEGCWLGEPVDAPFVLVLGGAGGGCLAIEGTAEALQALAADITAQVEGVSDAERNTL